MKKRPSKIQAIDITIEKLEEVQTCLTMIKYGYIVHGKKLNYYDKRIDVAMKTIDFMSRFI